MNRKLVKGFIAATVMSTLLTAQGMVTHAEVGAESTYTVASGDCLSSIARNVLGDEKRWKELYDLNSSSIKDPSLIYAGQILTLPQVVISTDDQSTQVTEAASEQTSQPAQVAQPTESIATKAPAQAPAAQDEEAIATALAKDLIAKATVIEPLVTGYLKEMESDTVKLVGLEHRIKSEESLARKIVTKAHEYGVTTQEGAGYVGDVLRYTLCSTTEDYLNMVDSTLKKLNSEGITVKVFKNTWGGSAYKGINTNLQADDVIVELQFHTNESFNAKEVTHELYEIIRAEDTPQEEKDRLSIIHDAEFENVPIPAGAPDYKWNN